VVFDCVGGLGLRPWKLKRPVKRLTARSAGTHPWISANLARRTVAVCDFGVAAFQTTADELEAEAEAKQALAVAVAQSSAATGCIRNARLLAGNGAYNNPTGMREN
jgi:hypothetical protein